MDFFPVDDTAKSEGIALKEVTEIRGQRYIMAVTYICIFKESEHPPSLEQCAICGSWVQTMCTEITSEVFTADHYFCCESMENTVANERLIQQLSVKDVLCLKNSNIWHHWLLFDVPVRWCSYHASPVCISTFITRKNASFVNGQLHH